MFRLMLTVLVVMLTDLMLRVDADSGAIPRGENVAKILYCAQKETHIFNVAISNELFD